MSCKKVLKYTIEDHTDNTIFEFPIGAKIVSASIQYSKLKIWVELDQSITHMESRIFKVFETGEEIPQSAKFIITVFDSGFVWHLYEM